VAVRSPAAVLRGRLLPALLPAAALPVCGRVLGGAGISGVPHATEPQVVVPTQRQVPDTDPRPTPGRPVAVVPRTPARYLSSGGIVASGSAWPLVLPENRGILCKPISLDRDR